MDFRAYHGLRHRGSEKVRSLDLPRTEDPFIIYVDLSGPLSY